MTRQDVTDDETCVIVSIETLKLYTKFAGKLCGSKMIKVIDVTN